LLLDEGRLQWLEKAQGQMISRLLVLLAGGAFAQLLACSSEAVSSEDPEGSGGRSNVPQPPSAGSSGTGEDLPGLELRVPVRADETSYVSLAQPEVIELDEDPLASNAWDLAFRGWDVFTNGGISGGGSGWSFGPTEYYYLYFPGDSIEVPFPIPDRASGAFLGWYAYGPDHGLFSRFHVYGVRSGDRLYKLQVLGYRGEVQGTAVNALYRVRYAEVSADGEGPLVDLSNLDATANNNALDPNEPSTCLDLASQQTFELTPDQAAESEDWDLCFRRDVITVNGGVGGPRGVEAVDLDAANTEQETIEQVMALTAQSQLARLESTTYEMLSAPGLDYRGDTVMSAFSGRWYEDGDPRSPVLDKSWLVVGPDGETRYYIVFTEFEDARPDSPGTVVLRVQAVASD
jgi:hypothetical protein